MGLVLVVLLVQRGLGIVEVVLQVLGTVAVVRQVLEIVVVVLQVHVQSEPGIVEVVPFVPADP